MADSSDVTVMDEYPTKPEEFFARLLSRQPSKLVMMDLATVDEEFGVLTRTLIYRQLLGDAVVFITERNSRKYKNIMDNPKVSLTMLFPEVPGKNGIETWQVRLFDAIAIELDASTISDMWEEQPIYAKIRSHICVCGKPIDKDLFKHQHDQILENYKKGINKLEQTPTFTAFKVVANRWDFYKSEENKIANRLQYVADKNTLDEDAKQWSIGHVAP